MALGENCVGGEEEPVGLVGVCVVGEGWVCWELAVPGFTAVVCSWCDGEAGLR